MAVLIGLQGEAFAWPACARNVPLAALGRVTNPLLASRASRSSSSSGAEALSHAQHLRGLFPALEQLGYDIDELLAAGGLRREDVEDPDAYVSPRNCSLVFARA
jgi:hypothetical protein